MLNIWKKVLVSTHSSILVIGEYKWISSYYMETCFQLRCVTGRVFEREADDIYYGNCNCEYLGDTTPSTRSTKLKSNLHPAPSRAIQHIG